MTGRRGSRSHRHTKFNRYTGDVTKRRPRAGIGLWWLIPVSALAAVIFALTLGNCLGSKVDGIPESTPTDSAASEPPISEPALPETVDVGNVDAIFVGLEGITDNTNAEVSKQIPEGTRAISLSMFLSNGSPLYKSEVAIASGKPSGELTLKNIFRYANENGLYVSVPFPSGALISRDEMLWGMDAAYEIAMIKELYEAGADEVIIRCSKFGESGVFSIGNEDFVQIVCEYLSEIRIKVPDIHIGLMISKEDSEDGIHTAEIDKINGYADFIAANMTGFNDAEELKAAANAALVNLLRYEMRGIVGGNEETLPSIYQVLDTLGIKNRQVATK
jgi:hypothetical protein